MNCHGGFPSVLVLSLVLSGPNLRAAGELTVSWTNNMLTLSGPDIPGGKVDIW